MCQEPYCPFLQRVHSSYNCYLNLKDSVYFSKYTFPRWVDKRSEVQGERIVSKESEKDVKLVKRNKLVYVVAFLTNTEII